MILFSLDVPHMLSKRHDLVFSLPLLTVAIMASGCVQEPIDVPKTAMPQSFFGSRQDKVSATVTKDWWVSFGDDNLTRLVQLGAENNPELKQANARVKQARAQVGLASSSLLPSISGGGGETRGDKYGFGTSTTKSYGTVSGTWLIDIFGGARAQKRAALAKLDSAVADEADTRINVTTTIATIYVDLRYYQARIALGRQTVENRKRSLSLLHDSQGAGQISQLQIVQGEQLVAKAEAELPAIEVQLESSLDSLTSLTGQSVAELRARLLSNSGQPKPKYKIGVGIPADVIRNRPDVQKAESSYIAAAEGVGVAKAAFYPSLQLSGFVTPTAVVNTGHVNVWQIAADVSTPIFDGGKNRANLAESKAKLDEARAAWEASVLKGIAEVEKALAAYNTDSRNVAAQEKLVSTSQETLRLGRVSFELGSGEFFNILDAERDYLEAQQSRTQAIRDQALHYIALCKAAPADQADKAIIEPKPMRTAGKMPRGS